MLRRRHVLVHTIFTFSRIGFGVFREKAWVFVPCANSRLCNSWDRFH